jgi:hypothetical protein
VSLRQQRRLEQKLARKAAKNLARQQTPEQPTVSRTPRPSETEQGELTPLTPPTAQSVPAISQAKMAANHANAQLSPGPVTTIGKQAVSQNATKHGLTGKFQVLADESQADFDQLLADFMRGQEPANQQEVEFVQQMAEALWLSTRARRLQDRCLTVMCSGTPEQQNQAKKDLALYMRYQTTHERAFSRFSTELRKRRNERLRNERGFVSQKHREAAERRREELHQTRQKTESLRHERIQIQDRIAAARAERLELQNFERLQRQNVAKTGESVAAAA